jgi:general secretion pathway protein D
MIRRTSVVGLIALALNGPLRAQPVDSLVRLRNDSLTVRLVDVDLRVAFHALARYLDRPLMFGALPSQRVTFETPSPVPRASVSDFVSGIANSFGVEFAFDSTGGFYRVAAQVPQRSPGWAAPTRGRNGDAPAFASATGQQLFVIRLRHARAADVAAGVNALYGRSAALGELGSFARPANSTLDAGLRQNAQAVSGQGLPRTDQSATGVMPEQGTQATAPSEGPARVASRQAALTGEVTIVPDERTNALLVRASRLDYELINAAVEQLDVRPLQVLIEVLIAEVRRDRDLSFGLSTSADPTSLGGSAGGTLGGDIAGGGGDEFVVRLLDFRMGTTQLNATLRAAASRGNVRIVSRPVLIATNNELSEILVGSQRPFVQVQRSLPTDAPSRDQVIQYRDVGTRLSVRPTISADGYVMISLTQEVNAATSETAFDAPVISTRSLQTQLLVKDQQTVVLGGLIDQQKDEVRAGVPVLSSIPLLGGLFGRWARRTRETELFVFLTPRVIRDDAEAEALTESIRSRTEGKDR